MSNRPGRLMSLYDQQHELTALLLESRARSDRYRAKLTENILRVREAIRRARPPGKERVR